jgi:uncharacterized protein (DUF433 family)
MEYEKYITTDKHGTPIIKEKNIPLFQIMILLQEGKTINEIIQIHKPVNVNEIAACLEYAKELIILSQYDNATVEINKHFLARKAIANKIRALKKPPFFD